MNKRMTCKIVHYQRCFTHALSFQLFYDAESSYTEEDEQLTAPTQGSMEHSDESMRQRWSGNFLSVLTIFYINHASILECRQKMLSLKYISV